MIQFIVYPVLALFIMMLCSCGRYSKESNQTGNFMWGMDKDRAHRLEENKQRNIDEDKQKRNVSDRSRNSNTGSIRYFLY